jgi:hypothetical protein
MGEEPRPRPLPPRPPRPLLVHWAVDAAVTFLGVVLVALFAGISIWIVVVVALVVGWLVAPFTRRAEMRGLAAREAHARGEEPPAPS